MEIANRDWIEVHRGPQINCHNYYVLLTDKYKDLLVGKKLRIVVLEKPEGRNTHALQVF
jgi:hypothetical protein